MKIGILTFQNAINYGAVLQAYALCAHVRQFCDCEIIDYHNPHTVWGPITGTLKGKLRRGFIEIKYFCRKSVFRAFWKKTGFLSPETYMNRVALKAADDKYSAFIAGSDQVWNPHNTDTDTCYFLDFVTGGGERRSSYAASFGTSRAVGELPDEIIRMLASYGSLSVREPGAAAALQKRLNGRTVPNHMDPVFLMGSNEWGKLASPSPNSNYVLIYTMSKSDRLVSYARDIARYIGADVYMIPVGLKREPGIKYFTNTGPKEFLGLMRGAAHVVTNSFHGVAFSLIFQRPLTLQCHSTNERIVNLVSLLGLESRCFADDKFPDYETVIDYHKIADIIQAQARIAQAYLKNLCAEV